MRFEHGFEHTFQVQQHLRLNPAERFCKIPVSVPCESWSSHMQLSASETAARLPYPELADAIAVMLQKRLELTAPERSAVNLGNGNTLLLMPAASRDLTITKLVTVHPNNLEGLPTIQSDVVVMRTGTGVRLGILDGVVTERRTAALSLLAAKTLAPRPDGPLLIFGAGVQARAHLKAFHVGLDVKQVFIASRTRAKAAELVAYAQSLGMDAQLTETPADVAAEVPLIVTATTSRTPVLTGPVRRDTLICAVGSFQPEVAEVAVDVIAESRVVVDTLEATETEAGDLLQAVAAGRLRWSEVVELESLLKHPVNVDRPTVFKSVGHALFDLAAAHVAFGVPIAQL